MRSLSLEKGTNRPQILARGLNGVGGLAWSSDEGGNEIWFFAVKGDGPAIRAVSLSGKTERVVLRTPGYLVLADVGGGQQGAGGSG